MRSFIIFCITAVFSLTCFSAKAAAQNVLGDLSAEQVSEGKELREEYTTEKEDLQVQLQKLIKDRDVALRDKNTSLVERRNREIKQTRDKIKNLPKEYSSQFSDMLTDDQKENNVSDDFYDKELAAELGKIKESEPAEKEKPAAEKKKPSPKKQPAKKQAKTKK